MYFKRLLSFYNKHGLSDTLGRALLEIKRRIFHGRAFLFITCLRTCNINYYPTFPSNVKVDQIGSESQISSKDMIVLTSHWNEEISKQQIQERLEKGAILWLAKNDSDIIGFGWSIVHSPIESHFFPLNEKDVHLFDYFVFPEYRGRNFNPALVNHILMNLRSEGYERVHIEAYSWNTSQLRSLRKTPFQLVGVARKIDICKRTIVIWHKASHHNLQGN